MDDLISRKAAIEAFDRIPLQRIKGLGLELLISVSDAKNILEGMKAIDAAPVKHGRWEEPEPEGIISYNRGSYAQCSVCKKKSYLGRADKYCRYCGAKMDLEE